MPEWMLWAAHPKGSFAVPGMGKAPNVRETGRSYLARIVWPAGKA